MRFLKLEYMNSTHTYPVLYFVPAVYPVRTTRLPLLRWTHLPAVCHRPVERIASGLSLLW